MAIIDFGGTKEEVITRQEFPMARARKVLKDETIAIIGYGVQGPAQGLNLRDNGFNVIVGQAKSFKRDWDRAVADGWVPGKTLFDIGAAAVPLMVTGAAIGTIDPKIICRNNCSLATGQWMMSLSLPWLASGFSNRPWLSRKVRIFVKALPMSVMWAVSVVPVMLTVLSMALSPILANLWVVP